MRASALTISLLLGCGASGAESEGSESTDSGTETSVSTSTNSTTGFLEPTPCESSADCEAGVCAAPYDPGSANPIGPAKCVPGCLEADDATRYCIDDASCCDGLVCSGLGLCEEPAAETSSDEGDTDESDTGAATDETGTTGD